MADRLSVYRLLQYKFIRLAFIICLVFKNSYQDIVGCGGFVKSQVSIDFSKVEIKLYTKQGTLKESSDCAPTNGYYFIPLYDKGEYLLKIEPPAGWYFEPKEVHLNFDGVSDPCSKSNDINFVFKGFAIRGKVISAGSNEGPENIVVNLISETDKSLVANTTTGKSGYFQFTPVVPDNYVIKVKNDKYKFSKDSVKIKVKEQTGELPIDSLVIAGYDITGQVLFNGEPTKGVSFILFANDEQNKNLKLTDCVKTPLPNYPFRDFLCHVTSNEKGVFHMKTLPPGSYKIKPYYSKFDVKPEEINVVVRHGHILLSDKFLVKGFSVGGRVLTSPGGSGIKNALIYLNGVKVAVSDDDGRYNLDSMEPGTYILSVEADDVKFEGVQVKVSPNTPEIENIYPTEFKICGLVNPWLSRDETRMVEIRQTKNKQPIIKVAVDENSGKFCEFLKPGTYALKVIVSDYEKSTGMQYLPLTKEIHVKNGPVPGIEFTQLRGNIRGKVKKLPEVKTSAELTIKLKLKNSLVALKILEKNDLSYSFNEVMPGFYDVEIENNEWCFQNQVHSISVSSSETTVPDFVQTGFKVRIWSSHKTSAIVRDSDPNGNYKVDLVLERGENAICLPHSSPFKLEPFGCHGFEKEVYLIDVKDGGFLRLYATSHEVTGFIRSHSLENDLVVEVALPNRQVIRLGPLRGEKVGNEFVYRFSYKTGENQILKFTPSSTKLLFHPEFFEYRTINDCSNDAIQFTGERGLIIEGVVNPPLANVKITLKTNPSSSNAEEVVFVTQSDGRYKFGPLRKTIDYELKAEKESYILTGPDKNGVFKAHKLAEINVKVMDNSTKEPLQGVLLSLTGGEKYRKNSMTGEEGQLTFHSLSPGEYFLRPMMKEYKFEPSSQIIQIKEGVTESIELRGRRVSFSAYGMVTSLNGEPEPNVVIEAVGLNTCSNLQEDGSSEANGQFRIRGLLPQCEYQIRLKSGPDVNLIIHRLAPQDLIVKTNKGDVRDIQLTAFQLIDQTDVAVHVESTIPEHLKTLKLKLYKDDSPDSPIHVVKLDSLAGGVKQWGNHDAQERFLKAGLLVLLPNIPRDKGVYFIQLESSLNKHTYNYKEPVVHFSADKTYRSLKMSFEPVLKTMDHELSQSNYIVLPLVILAALFYNYFNKAVPVIQNIVGSLNNQFASAREERNFYSHNSMADNVSIEPVGVTVVKRKPKPRKT